MKKDIITNGDRLSWSYRTEDPENYGYYALPREFYDGQSNREGFDLPLLLNCAGIFSSCSAFTTDRREGRLDYQLMYILSGSLTLFHEKGNFTAHTGSVVILPPHIGHRYSSEGGEKLSYLWAHFTGGEADLRLKEYGIETFPTVYETAEGKTAEESFKQIFEAFSREDRYLERELSALLDRLLIILARNIVRREERISSLFASLSLIRANYSKDIRIAELAAAEHLSVSRFNFVFKEQMGIPPTKYILKLRMASAAELLTSTDLSVKQIGYMCGYGDAHFFSKVFRGYYGVSPSEYRNNT